MAPGHRRERSRYHLTLMIDDALFDSGTAADDEGGFAEAFRGFSGKVRIESTHDVKEIYATGDLA